MLHTSSSELAAEIPPPLRRDSGHAQFRRRDRLQLRLGEHPIPGVDQAEVEEHFATMPLRYWEHVTKAELIWGVETVHRFLRAPSSRPDPLVVADSRHYPERGFTKVMICCWDRPGLLAKIAAAFCALRVNILRADVYTRTDGLALDLFEVGDPHHGHLVDEDRLKHLEFLLEGALSDPPRFASFWTSEFLKILPPATEENPKVTFDNEYSPEHTVVRIETADRLGLLHDLLYALSEFGLNIAQALVETDHHKACDIFYVTDLKGARILIPETLEELRKALFKAVLR